MRQILGYIVALIGAGVLALTLDPVREAIGITLPETITNIMLTATGLVLVVVGIFLLMRSGEGGRSRQREVPIYHGRHVVGYRRH